MTLHFLRLALLIIAGFSAIASVAGLGAVFRGAYIPVMLVGVGMEIGKIATTAYAYQNWHELSLRFKVGTTIFITAISLFTSAGIYGYLGESFQSAHTVVQKDDIILNQLIAEKNQLESRILEIDKQIRDLPSEFVNGRLKLIKAFEVERSEIRARLSEINPKIATVSLSNVDTVNSLGPIIILAKTLGITVENAIGYMMLAMTLLLDPFAIMLTLLINRKVTKQKPEPVKNIVKPVEESVEKVANEWNFK